MVYNAPEDGAKVLAGLLGDKKDARILDAGAGTGLVGEVVSRPISIIPTIGKILERIVQRQCSAYLKSHNILTEAQSGFRQSQSTDTCLINFLDPIYSAID